MEVGVELDDLRGVDATFAGEAVDLGEAASAASIGVREGVEGVESLLGAGETATAPEAETATSDAAGIVYRRTDLNGGKPYIGQAKSEARFLARQAEHARANPDADFEFEILGRAEPGTAQCP